MSGIPDVNYTKKFEVDMLPRIHGKPDYSKLKVLKDLLKTNASRVSSDLGGGAHGHLGLILTPLEYATVENNIRKPSGYSTKQWTLTML